MPNWLRFFFCLIVSACLIYGDLHLGVFNAARQNMSLILVPFRTAAQLPENSYHGMRDYLSDRETLLAEKSRLQSEIFENSVRLKSLEFFVQQNEELRRLLDLQAQAGGRWIIAEIESNAAVPLVERIHLNKGFQDGIVPGLGVVDPNGVVGQIVRVNEYTSTANLLTDAKQFIAAYVQRNGLLLILRGDGADRLVIEYTSRTADLKEGDTLLAAGGGLFPPGYPVGVVDAIRQGPVYLDATAAPVSQFWDNTTLMIYQQEGNVDGGGADADDAEMVDYPGGGDGADGGDEENLGGDDGISLR